MGWLVEKISALALLLLLNSGFAIGQNDDRIIFDIDSYMRDINRRTSPRMTMTTTGRPPVPDADPKCVLPPEPKHGHYDIIGIESSPGELVDVSTTLVFTCKHGYDLIASDPTFKGIVICEEGGKWTHTIECTKNGATVSPERDMCILPQFPKNGEYEAIGGSSTPGEAVPIGSQITYSCDDGYHADEGGFIFCTEDGTWSSTIQCKSSSPDTNPPLITTSSTTYRPSTNGATKQCISPKYPKNGRYLVNGVNVAPYTSIPEYNVMTYNCDEGYTAEPSDTSYCLSGKWDQPEISCVRTCDNLISYSLHLTCVYNGEIIDCNQPMKNGTRVSMKCTQYYKKIQFLPMTTMKCINGKWIGKLPYCTPDCGEDKSSGLQFILKPKDEKRDSSPWHVGIYRIIKGVESYQCGGTIVSNKIVISAAHCFDDGNRKLVDHKQYMISAGKLYSDWNHNEIDEFPYIQRTGIEDLHIPTGYYGHELQMHSDVAVVILKEILQFSDSVHPACMDLTNPEFSDNLLRPGNQGKVVGWGVTQEGNLGSVAVQLKKAILPLIGLDTCRAGVPLEFEKYTRVEDKFCAGYNDQGPTVCSGDSGGGFLANITEKNVRRWYLLGVVSVGPKDDNRITCRENSYTLFTKLQKHSDFIERIVSEYK